MQLQQHQQIRASLGALRLVGLLALISAFAGCQGTPSTTITTDGGNVFPRSLRLAIDRDGSKASASDPHTGDAMEIEAGRARGGGYQTLEAGQYPVLINNTAFNGPQQLRNSFDFNYADLAYRGRRFFDAQQRLGIEFSVGIGYASMGLTVASPTRQGSGYYGNMGGTLGGGLIWRMRPGTSVEFRGAAFRLPIAFVSDGINRTDRVELFFAQALGDNVALRAGYASWVISGSTGGNSSDFRTTFSGPMVDLGLDF